MEEILASIRKIISEDSTEAPAPAAAAVPADKAAEPDVLELTQEVEVSAPAAPRPEAAKPPVEDIVFQTDEEPAPAPMPAPAPVSSAPVSAAPAPVSVAPEGIFSDKTRKAIDDAFATLDAPEEPKAAAPAAPSFSPRPAAADGDSVEAVFERAVRAAVGPHIDQWMAGQKDELIAAMKPLIREWMDDHFPALLEGAVRDEVARVVKARGRR
jgi:cell pole-organizing protein PopZ